MPDARRADRPAPLSTLVELTWRHLNSPSTPGLLLVPSSVGQISGDSTAKLEFARNEFASLAWLIEERWEGGLGSSVDRPTAFNPPPPLVPAHDADHVWRLVEAHPGRGFPCFPRTDSRLGPVHTRFDVHGRHTRSALATDLTSSLPGRGVPRTDSRLRRCAHLAHASDGTPSRGSHAPPDRPSGHRCRWTAVRPIRPPRGHRACLQHSAVKNGGVGGHLGVRTHADRPNLTALFE